MLEPASQDCPNILKKKIKLWVAAVKKNVTEILREKIIFKRGSKYLQKQNSFYLDEMITGFRWSINGAQDFYGVKPDLTTLEKRCLMVFLSQPYAEKKI